MKTGWHKLGRKQSLIRPLDLKTTILIGPGMASHKPKGGGKGLRLRRLLLRKGL
jgi:hypothetical protein